MNRFEYCHPDNNSDNDSFGSFSYLLQHNSVLIFILWRSVRKSTIILGMKKLRWELIRKAKKKKHKKTHTFKGILFTSCVIFSYPKLLSISVLTFIKWRLTPNYVAKDTIFSESINVCFLPRVDSFSFDQEPHVVYCF
jgi:hypothetical protein